MAPSSMRQAKTSSVRLLEDLPGIADVVWATVTRLDSARIPTTVLFTAAEKRAGTSMLASATAIGLARHQRVPVCLIETNVRCPALAGYLDLECAGLSDVLDGRAELESCLQEQGYCPGLFVLTAGTARAPVPGEFTTDRMTAILAQMEQRCQYLVLDTAPVLEHVESRLLLHRADAVVLVLRARATRRTDAERAHDILIESGTPVLGSIFNDYRADGLSGHPGGSSLPFRKIVRADLPRAGVLPSGLPEEIAGAEIDALPIPLEVLEAATNGMPISANGGHAFEASETGAHGSESAHRRQVDILERRIAKLTHLLAQTEANLLRIAVMKNVDLGIASIHRDVQGLSVEEEAFAFKQSLMREIFQANVELKTAISRHS